MTLRNTGIDCSERPPRGQGGTIHTGVRFYSAKASYGAVAGWSVCTAGHACVIVLLLVDD